jgi:hypothetical protein
MSFDGGKSYVPETFCDQNAPPASPAWCTWDVEYTYVTVSGVLKTHIVEKLVGHGDPVGYR